jgi:hypothetical protein
MAPRPVMLSGPERVRPKPSGRRAEGQARNEGVAAGVTAVSRSNHPQQGRLKRAHEKWAGWSGARGGVIGHGVGHHQQITVM